jgi:hypothetical protein
VRRDVRLLLLIAAACAVVGLGASSGGAVIRTTCTSPEKARFEARAASYAKQMLRDRARYFKAHKSAKARAAFINKQKAKLRAFRAQPACDDTPPPPSPPPPPPPPPPIDLNPSPTANETFNFGPGMSAPAVEEIKGDIAFAAEDVQRLLGISTDKAVVFASTDANWLAGLQCGFYPDTGTGCQAQLAAFYTSGGSTAQGGPGGGVFIYWAAPSWGGGAGSNQKIIAHELFHALQYQTDHLIDAGRTPWDQVRATGPTWLDEGAPR